MILVVCPNLAIDVTLEVDRLAVGAVHRARATRRQAGGKGVNVARALGALGETAMVLGFAAGRSGDAIASGLNHEGIPHELIAVGSKSEGSGENRTCTVILCPDGSATVVNEAGPYVEDGGELFRRFQRHLREAKAVALMGSLPPGIPETTYRDMADHCRRENRYCLLDTSGGTLAYGLKGQPSVVKPNRLEAEELLQTSLGNARTRREAIERLRALGAELAVVTFGAEGIWLGNGEIVARCGSTTTDLTLGNPTGAGDALAAGILAGHLRGYRLEDTMRLAVAVATASLAEGYGRIRARDVRVEAVRFDPMA